MKANLQRRIQRYGWDKAASCYEEFWRAQLEPAQTQLLQFADLKPGERILDIACGTGLVTLPAARQVGWRGAVTATDLSEQMVASVCLAAQCENLGNVQGVRMDAESLDFPDASFDAALCALGLMYVPDPLRALQEMRRVTRPGGRAVAAVWGERKNCGWAEIFPIVDARVQSDVCPLFFQLGTGAALKSLFEAAGFGQTETVRLSTLMRYPSEEEALGAAFAGGPVALAYSRFDDPTRQEAHADYLASIECYRVGKGYEIPGEFVVVHGLTPPP